MTRDELRVQYIKDVGRYAVRHGRDLGVIDEYPKLLADMLAEMALQLSGRDHENALEHIGRLNSRMVAFINAARTATA